MLDKILANEKRAIFLKIESVLRGTISEELILQANPSRGIINTKLKSQLFQISHSQIGEIHDSLTVNVWPEAQNNVTKMRKYNKIGFVHARVLKLANTFAVTSYLVLPVAIATIRLNSFDEIGKEVEKNETLHCLQATVVTI